MQIDGIIEGGIAILNDRVLYRVANDTEKYRVCSTNRQAAKDAVFLREGQHIRIRGEPDGKTVLVKEAKIDIRRI